MLFENINEMQKKIIVEKLPFLEDFEIKGLEVHHDWKELYSTLYHGNWEIFALCFFEEGFFDFPSFRALDDYLMECKSLPHYIFLVRRETNFVHLWVMKYKDKKSIVAYLQKEQKKRKKESEDKNNIFREAFVKALASGGEEV